MLASSSVPEGSDADAPVEIIISGYDKADLDNETRLSPGIRATIDLASPNRWSRLRITNWDDSTRAALRVMIGEAAVSQLAWMGEHLTATGRTEREVISQDLSVDTSAAAPWLRVAGLDAIDRWAHLPLNQSVMDAERAVARDVAARTLADEFQHRLINEALTIARMAASGLSQYLSDLRPPLSSLPSGLHSALGSLVEGYADLLTHVQGHDARLIRVLQTWSRRDQGLDLPSPGRARRRTPQQRASSEPSAEPLTKNLVDPRQLRARLVEIGADPGVAEVAISRTGSAETNAVLVTVAAYGQAPPVRTMTDRLLVRLIDERGQAHDARTLTLTPDGFQGLVPLRGSNVATVRADIFDVDSEVPPASMDTDEDLQRVRSATVFLREWRRLLSEERLPAPVADPGRRLHDIAGLLANRPAFHGGPSEDDLNSLAAADPDERDAALRGQECEAIATAGIRRWLAATQGAGALSVAELAATYAS